MWQGWWVIVLGFLAHSIFRATYFRVLRWFVNCLLATLLMIATCVCVSQKTYCSCLRFGGPSPLPTVIGTSIYRCGRNTYEDADNARLPVKCSSWGRKVKAGGDRHGLCSQSPGHRGHRLWQGELQSQGLTADTARIFGALLHLWVRLHHEQQEHTPKSLC